MIRFLIIGKVYISAPLQQPDQESDKFARRFPKMGTILQGDSMWVNRNLGFLSLVKKQEWYWPPVTCHLWPSTGSSSIQNRVRSSSVQDKESLQSGCWAPRPSLLSFVFPFGCRLLPGTRDSRSLTYTFPDPSSLIWTLWFQSPQRLPELPHSPTLEAVFSWVVPAAREIEFILIFQVLYISDEVLWIFCPEKKYKYFWSIANVFSFS